MGSADHGEETMQGLSGREEERILVSVRVRPLNEKEASRNEVIDWECVNDTTIIYKNHSSPERSMYPTSYSFDRVFSCDCSTRQVYEEGAKAVVLSVVGGINSSVFAYGQTSSGKTFTMSGITEYTMEEIFDYIQKHKEREFQLKFSAMEIYNESVRDLLTEDNSSLRVLDDPERGTVVEKLTEETLRDWNHFKELLAVCEAQRQIGETFLNEASSRSHQILRLTIESSAREFTGKNNSSILAATLNFVDLAGSERASQALSAGSRLKEGSHINRSLLTLGTVIRKLSKGRTGHIPYRDSKLTRILQSSLGGNARTAIICTMSPARSYVEQSRNTLLFASCAKEVTTDAQVNVVMSDKALVKQLQRELARLESELRSASPPSRADANDLLREKDYRIEELERRVRELTVQLDLALSKIHNLQQGAGDRSPNLWEVEETSYPKLHVRQASEISQSETTTAADHRSSSAASLISEAPQSPDRHSGLSYDENYSISDLEENLPPSSPSDGLLTQTPSDISPTLLIQTANVVPKVSETPNSIEVVPHQVSEDIEGQSPDTFEIHLQQVSDRQGADSPYFVEFDPYQVPYGTEDQTPGSFEIDQFQNSKENAEQTSNNDNSDPHPTPKAFREQTDEHLEDDCKEVQCIESEMTDNVRVDSLPPKDGRESSLLSTSLENYCHPDDEVKPESELKNMNPSSIKESKEPSTSQHIDDVPDCENLNCIESSICQSNDKSRASYSSSCLEKFMYEMINGSNGGGEEFLIRLEDIHRKLSALKCDIDSETSQLPAGDIRLDEIPGTDIEVSDHIDDTKNCTPVAEIKEITEPQCMKRHPECQVEDMMQEVNKSIKNMKDVGLSPQDDLDASLLLPSDCEKLQREIIILWDFCNVSLMHRTYFFLLFMKGDPADTIYMEVERRRLSFLKDSFSWGNSIVLDGREVTPGSSTRTLHSERKMLEKLMKKRFSRQERTNLYLKWGISLDVKRRSSKLAHRLWTVPNDMDHVEESAHVVAKLVRFSEAQVPKEVFGLNLLNNTQKKRKSFKWKPSPSLSCQKI